MSNNLHIQPLFDCTRDEAIMFDLIKYKECFRRFEFGDSIVGFVSSIAAVENDNNQEIVSSKFELFNDYFLPGNILLIGGETDIGKSHLVYDMIKELYLRQRKSVALFSLATTEEEIYLQLLSRFLGCNVANLRCGQLSQSDWDKLYNGLGALLEDADTHKLFIDTTPFMGVEYFEKSLKSFIEKGCEYAFIDYIQLMEVLDGRSFQNESERITYVFRYLKQLAKQFGIPVVVISQFPFEGNDTIAPSAGQTHPLSTFHNFGTQYEDADVVMIVDGPEVRHVYQEGYGRDLHRILKISVLKDRNDNLLREIVLFWDTESYEYITYEEHMQGHRRYEEGGQIVESKINGKS